MLISRRIGMLLLYAIPLNFVSEQHGKNFVVSAFVARVTIPNTMYHTTTLCSKGNKKTNDDKEAFIQSTQIYRKPKQKRRKPKNQKRPSAFWADVKNIEKELRLFWSSVNVPISSSEPPPIPNEALLNHFERHDLRYGIAKKGRQTVADELGGAKLIPGKWSDAIDQSEEVQCLLSRDNPAGSGLSSDVPPIAPHKKRKLVRGQVSEVKKRMHNMIMNSFLSEDEPGGDSAGTSEILAKKFPDILINESFIKGDDGMLDFAKINEEAIRNLRYSAGERWAQQENRKPRGYWNHDIIIEELFDYVEYMKKTKGRPSIWMPRHSEISDEGRDDLSQAITRFGGADVICSMANLVPYKEWLYFESQLELFIELEAYLVKHKLKTAGANEESVNNLFFPKLADIRRHGHNRLHDLVMDFGGRKMTAIRLGMEYQAQTSVEIFRGMSYGDFNLEFAIKLLLFVRKEMMRCEPFVENDSQRNDGVEGKQLDKNHIEMPTIGALLLAGETRLAQDVKKYGGHESVARRLHLRINYGEAEKDSKAARNTLSNRK